MKRYIRCSEQTNKAFICPTCRNRTLFDIDAEVSRNADVDYNDRFVCDECASEFVAVPQYDGQIKFKPLVDEDSYDDDYVMSAHDIICAEDSEESDELDHPDQKYTSKNTSINRSKLPAIFRLVNFNPGTVNLDYGGGKFDIATEYLADKGVTNLIYDPYNRSSEHNNQVINEVKSHGGADTVTLSNVLNVIKEPQARRSVLENIKKLLKPAGTLYITVYEGSGDGAERPTSSGYQLNRKTSGYLDEIQEVFPSAERKGKLIVASRASKVSSATRIWSDPEGLEPPDYDVGEDIQHTIDVPFDLRVAVDTDGSWDLVDTDGNPLPEDTSVFADPEDSNGMWVLPDTYHRLADPSDMFEYFADIADSYMPVDPGVYNITGTASFVFDVTGLRYEQMWDSYENESYTEIDDQLAESEFNRHASTIKDFKFKSVK